MPFKLHASRRHKIPKTRYAVKNWPAYEAAFRQRGDVRIWIGGDVEAHWTLPGKRTAKGYPVYTDLAVETVLTLRLVFHQALRQTEGMSGSLFGLMDLNLSVSGHSTLSRCGRGLECLGRQPSAKGSLDLVVDSTGLKVYGQGEWQRERFGGRKTGKPCSAWRKLHIGLDPDDGEIAASDLTGHDVGGVTVLPGLVDQVEGRLGNFLADGAYDGDPACRLLKQRRQALPLPEAIVPPRGAGQGPAKAEDLLRQCGRHVQTVQDRGRMNWQKASGYNRRALAEASVSRYKRIIGPGLKSRHPGAQHTEAMIGVDILSQMFDPGRPVTERIG